MKKTPQETWTLWGIGLIVQAGTFIEYQSFHQVRVARVQKVTISHVPPYPDTQVIHVKRYGPLRRHDGLRDDKVLPEKVICVFDGPPPPAPKALTSLWSPRDPENPFRCESTLTNEEWKECARWYPFSIRVLVRRLPEGNIAWHEQARTQSWHEAKDAIEALALRRNEPSTWIAMACELRGKEGREKPALWYPSQSTVERAIRD